MDSFTSTSEPTPGASSEATPGPNGAPTSRKIVEMEAASTFVPPAIDEGFTKQELFPLLVAQGDVNDETRETSETVWNKSVKTANLLAVAVRQLERDPNFVTKYKNAMKGNASDMFFASLADQDFDFTISLVALLRFKHPNLTLSDDPSPSPTPGPSNAGPAQDQVDMIRGFGSNLEDFVGIFGEDAAQHFYDIFPDAAVADQPPQPGPVGLQTAQAVPIQVTPSANPTPARPWGADDLQFIRDMQSYLPVFTYNNIKTKLQSGVAALRSMHGTEGYRKFLEVGNDLYQCPPEHQFPARLIKCLQNHTCAELAENM
ncbi:hypothetical protein K491DRAFT_710485 [Lophiostoma macrostomum CBS 122681]|uniref:Uncharacterized protein n=1 Tax=Lophiostoma macrostomum CBS 122681 TaxID=1314788 RepID=A0A6A6TPS2_9PLEO|nr:hypothetical protein K491DRAFT_710485 [Lophiostoma macrostomum CBS 122681]